MSFTVWSTSVESERRAWLAAWQEWPEREVFAHPAYVELYENPMQRGICAAWRSGTGTILYPLLVRHIPDEDGVDLITPYGYGGPFFWGHVGPGGLFWQEFANWALERGAISEFVRFSLFPENLLGGYPGERVFRMQNVVRSLDLAEDALWREMDHKVRKNVKRARSCGVTIEKDPAGERLADFLRIYGATMDRRGASDGYYLPQTYFERMQRGLPGSHTWFHAWLDGQVIASELVLVSELYSYSFLGGTDSRFFESRPNDLLKFEIIRWSAEAGKRAYILGGGYASGDGIFRYKKAFAPNGEREFHVGRRVFDEFRYRTLIERRHGREPSWQPAADYFPAYRA